jgi:hypothetical protein
MFGMKIRHDADVPADDPVTDEMKATAAQLVRAAAETCDGTSPDTSAAETTVAEVETQFFPMSKDGTRVARPGGQHKWNNKEFPSAGYPTETVLVLRYLNADSLTGK